MMLLVKYNPLQNLMDIGVIDLLNTFQVAGDGLFFAFNVDYKIAFGQHSSLRTELSKTLRHSCFARQFSDFRRA